MICIGLYCMYVCMCVCIYVILVYVCWLYVFINIYIYISYHIYIYLHERAATLAVSFRGLRGHRGQRGHRGHVPRDCPVTPCVLYICPRGAWHLRSERCSGFTKDQWRYDGDMYIIMYISYIMLYHVLLYHVISSYIIISCCIMLYHVVSVSMLCLWFFGDLLVSIRGLSRRIRDTLSAWAFAAACVAVRVALKWSERRKT